VIQLRGGSRRIVPQQAGAILANVRSLSAALVKFPLFSRREQVHWSFTRTEE